jgi:surface protein
MFGRCPLTIDNLSSWDMSYVTRFDSMFNGCIGWNPTLIFSDISSATAISSMFKDSESFNCSSVSSWVIPSGLITMNTVFSGSTAFNQDLSSWDFSNVTSITDFGLDWGMSRTNYNSLLSSLSGQTLQNGLTTTFSSNYFAIHVTTGTTDGVTSNKLVDSTQSFTTNGTAIGDIILNNTDADPYNYTYAKVTAIDSDTTLSLDLDIMTSGNSYAVQNNTTAKERYSILENYGWDIKDLGPDTSLPMILKVKTDDLANADSDDHSIILPFNEGHTVNLTIDWGDGNSEAYTNTNNLCTHTYTTPGYQTIEISNGDGLSVVPLNIGAVASDRRDYSKFYDISQFGDCQIDNADGFGAFTTCSNLDITATDFQTGVLDVLTNGYLMFNGCNLGAIPNSSTWDTSGILQMRDMWRNNSALDLDVSNWELSQMTADCLYRAFAGTGDDSAWNPDTTSWNLTMSGDISMYYMLNNIENFNRDVTNLNPDGNDVTIEGLFKGCESFDGTGLDTWDTSNVTSFGSVLSDCDAVDYTKIEGWDSSKVTTMYQAFYHSAVSQVDIDLTGWDVSLCTNFAYLFANTLVNPDTTGWVLKPASSIAMFDAFKASGLVGTELNTWTNTGSIYTLHSTFEDALLFNGNLTGWDVSNVTDMSYTFQNTPSFTGTGLDTWVTTSVLTNLDFTFADCTNFNADLTTWVVSGVTSLDSTFNGADSFTGAGLDTWDVSGVDSMTYTFRDTPLDGSTISSWITSSVGSFRGCFIDTNSLDGSYIESWDIGGASDFRDMFYQNSSSSLATWDLSGWDFSSATTAYRMFYQCTNMNPDVSNWILNSTASSLTCDQMFYQCTSFTGVGVDTWTNTSAIDDMYAMFSGCTSFNQDLSSWDFSNVTDMQVFGNLWGMDAANYGKLLISLSGQTLQSGLTTTMSSYYYAGDVTTGTTDSANTNELIDSTQTFTVTVTVGDIIYNSTDDTYAEVQSVDSDTTLTLDEDIMTSGDSYSVQGSDAAKARYDVTYNDGWDITDLGTIAPNTFTANGGVDYPTADLLADEINLSESDMLVYNVDENNNVSFYANSTYSIAPSGFENSSLTTYIDVDGNWTSGVSGWSIMNGADLEYAYLPNTSWAAGSATGWNVNGAWTRINCINTTSFEMRTIDFEGTKLDIRNVTNMTPYTTTGVGSNLKYVNLESVTALTVFNYVIDSISYFSPTSGCTFYLSPYLQAQDRQSWGWQLQGGSGWSVGDTFTINGLTYTGVSGTPTSEDEWDVTSSWGGTAGLSNAINADTRIGTLGTITTGYDYADLGWVSDQIGATGNTVTYGGFTSSTFADGGNSGPTLIGGTDVHPTMYKLRDQKGAILVDVDNIVTVNAPSGLSVTNAGIGTIQISFTEPADNGNGTELYEVWIADRNDKSVASNYFYYTEVSRGGEILDISEFPLDTALEIKVRTQDGQMQFSEFSETVVSKYRADTFIGGVGASLAETPEEYIALVNNRYLDDFNGFNNDGTNINLNWIGTDFSWLPAMTGSEITYMVVPHYYAQGNQHNLSAMQGMTHAYFPDFTTGYTATSSSRNLIGSASSLTRIHLEALTAIGQTSLLSNGSLLKKLYLPNVTSFEPNDQINNNLLLNLTSLERFYIGNCTSTTESLWRTIVANGTLTNLNSGCKVYYNTAFGDADQTAWNTLLMTTTRVVGDIYTVNGLDYTCVTTVVTDGDWEIGGGVTEGIENLVDAINADTRTGTYSDISAEVARDNNSGRLLVYVDTPGIAGNAVTASYTSNGGTGSVESPTFFGGFGETPFLQALERYRSSVLIEVNNVVTVNPPTDFTLSNLDTVNHTVDINFTDAIANANGTECYEVWIADTTPYREHFEYVEVTTSGETIDLTEVFNDIGTVENLKVKIRTMDGQMQFSEFTDTEITS